MQQARKPTTLIAMITHGEQIRLSATERNHLVSLTGSSVDHIRTQAQLRSFVEAHLVNYPGRWPEEILLRRLLEAFLPA